MYQHVLGAGEPAPWWGCGMSELQVSMELPRVLHSRAGQGALRGARGPDVVVGTGCCQTPLVHSDSNLIAVPRART